MIRVLITGVGATPGICVAESLRRYFKKKIFIFGIDANPYAVGLYLTKFIDKSSIVKRITNNPKDYLRQIKSLVKKNNIQFIYPATDAEIVFLKKNEKALSPAVVISSELKTLEICTDKYKTFQKLKSLNLMHDSWIDSRQIKYPCVIKPRKSQGSKDVQTAKSKKEFDILVSRVKNAMYQTFADGKEFTIDCLFDCNGALLAAVPRRRIVTGGGTAIITETVRDDKLIDLVKRVGHCFEFRGQINIQVMNDKVIEINPRVGGASILSSLAGVNMPALSLKMFNKERVKKWYDYDNKVLTRYFDAVCISKQDVKAS